MTSLGSMRSVLVVLRTAVCLHHRRSVSSNVFKASPGLIFQSVSTDVFQNLALEDWIHDHVDLQRNPHVLLLCRNSPCVVVGRHQNPWQEADLKVLRSSEVPLARRRSGGGTVYHDLGNVNLTFFTSKKHYDRHTNLRLLISALKNISPQLDVHSTDRFDVLLNGHYKISGTAAKLGRTVAYHHCTVLCRADRALLSAALRPTCEGIRSNATPSVPSPVRNLQEEDPALDWRTVMGAVATQYNTEFDCSVPVQRVDPGDERAFPGIARLADELRSWEWTFGRTPKFAVHAPLRLHHDNGGDASTNHSPATTEGASATVEVKNGLIERCEIQAPPCWLPAETCGEFSSLLVGGRFCPGAAAAAAAAMLRTAPPGDERGARRLGELCRSVAALM